VLIVSRSVVFSCSFVELRHGSLCTSGQRLELELLSVKDVTMQMLARLLRIQTCRGHWCFNIDTRPPTPRPRSVTDYSLVRIPKVPLRGCSPTSLFAEPLGLFGSGSARRCSRAPTPARLGTTLSLCSTGLRCRLHHCRAQGITMLLAYTRSMHFVLSSFVDSHVKPHPRTDREDYS
jgi:hypothetical protein